MGEDRDQNQGSPREITVLESFPTPSATTNPYIHQLAEALEEDDLVTLRTFSWREALLGRYDVFHVHWPDALLAARTRPRRAAKVAQAWLLISRLRISRVPIVRTRHNATPHESSRTARWFERKLNELTTVTIHLTEASDRSERDIVIPHGHYRDWFAPFRREEVTRGRISFVGLIRRYKGVEDLIASYSRLAEEDPTVSLAIAGRPRDPVLETELRGLLADLPRTEAILEYVDDATLVQVITSSSLVVLPYRGMGNSGVALAALSLDRPILVPRGRTTESLRDEVGPSWVHLFEGQLTGDILASALASPSPSEPPAMELRGWESTASRHREAFGRAIAIREGTHG
ncbi:glycosyltransferase [Microbacterium sp. MC2]